MSNSFQTNVAAGLRALYTDQYVAGRGDRAIVNNIAILLLGNRADNFVSCLLVPEFSHRKHFLF